MLDVPGTLGRGLGRDRKEEQGTIVVLAEDGVVWKTTLLHQLICEPKEMSEPLHTLVM